MISTVLYSLLTKFAEEEPEKPSMMLPIGASVAAAPLGIYGGHRVLDAGHNTYEKHLGFESGADYQPLAKRQKFLNHLTKNYGFDKGIYNLDLKQYVGEGSYSPKSNKVNVGIGESLPTIAHEYGHASMKQPGILNKFRRGVDPLQSFNKRVGKIGPKGTYLPLTPGNLIGMGLGVGGLATDNSAMVYTGLAVPAAAAAIQLGEEAIATHKAKGYLKSFGHGYKPNPGLGGAFRTYAGSNMAKLTIPALMAFLQYKRHSNDPAVSEEKETE